MCPVAVAHGPSCSMWSLPAAGIELVSLALAGGFLCTVTPGKSTFSLNNHSIMEGRWLWWEAEWINRKFERMKQKVFEARFMHVSWLNACCSQGGCLGKMSVSGLLSSTLTPVYHFFSYSGVPRRWWLLRSAGYCNISSQIWINTESKSTPEKYNSLSHIYFPLNAFSNHWLRTRIQVLFPLRAFITPWRVIIAYLWADCFVSLARLGLACSSPHS